MLIARLFRITSALATYFNLKIKQFNIINIFINTKRDTRSILVAAYLLNSFK
jgi:hypothetical protein